MADGRLPKPLKGDLPPEGVTWIVDPELLQWATTRQAEAIETINRLGGYRAAARELGVNSSTVCRLVDAVRRRAAVQGYDPGHNMTKPVRRPFLVNKVSTYYDKLGNPTQQWVKQKLADEAYQELVRDGISHFLEDVTPLAPIAPAPADEIEREIVPWVNVGDGHLGMVAYELETGDKFDLDIAERELCGAIDKIVCEMRTTYETIVLNDLGDMTHAENYKGETERSGHKLDMAARFPVMIRVYSRVMRYLIDRLKSKCLTLFVVINRGNHSNTNDIWMAELIRVAFPEGSGIKVVANDNLFIAMRFGQTLVMTTHGHTTKLERLAKVLANDFRVDWGETRFAYIFVGHVHHAQALKEFPGVVAESFNTLAGTDGHAHDHAYRSRQSLTVVYLSRRYGDVGRRLLPIEEVRDHLAKARGVEVPSYPAPRRAISF